MILAAFQEVLLCSSCRAAPLPGHFPGRVILATVASCNPSVFAPFLLSFFMFHKNIKGLFTRLANLPRHKILRVQYGNRWYWHSIHMRGNALKKLRSFSSKTWKSKFVPLVGMHEQPPLMSYTGNAKQLLDFGRRPRREAGPHDGGEDARKCLAGMNQRRKAAWKRGVLSA